MKRIVFDIGAHKGEDSKYYLARGFKVIAFECSPTNLEFLEKRFKSEIESNDLVLEKRALVSGGGKNKKMNFFIDHISSWGTLNESWAKRNQRLGSSSKSILVETLNPEDIYSLYGNPYYMKINIQGCDMDVLKSINIIKSESRPEYLSFESTKTSWKLLMEEFSMLRELGYHKYQAVPQCRIGKQSTKWRKKMGEEICYFHENDSSGPFGEDLKNKWLDFRAIIIRYKFVFLKYKLFGDDGIFAVRKVKPKFLRNIYSRILSFTYLNADWFDTHAKHISKK